MSKLRDQLARGEFVVTAEIIPPAGADGDALMKRAGPLMGLADAVNVTDAASARAAMSSLAAAAVLQREGIEPVLQMTCRDRNRIGLAGDLIGAGALGIGNLLILHGDDPKSGDMPEATPVFDLDSRGLLTMARVLRDEGKLPSSRAVDPKPDFFIGCADMPRDPDDGWQPSGLEAKIGAGANFAQTQFCFDLATAKRYFARLTDLGITKRLKFIVGIGPLLSARQARFMDEKLFGVSIPASIIERLDQADDERAEGRKICVELIAGLSEIEGVSGVHIMAPMQSGAAIAETIKMTGLRTRTVL